MKRLRLGNKARKVFRGGSRGFSMLEVVIAIALFGIVAVSVLMALSTASAALIVADRRATAESLATTQMEWVLNQDFIDYSESVHDDYDTIEMPEGYEIEPIGVVTLETGLQKITVTVNYNIIGAENQELNRQFILEDYKKASGA